MSGDGNLMRELRSTMGMGEETVSAENFTERVKLAALRGRL